MRQSLKYHIVIFVFVVMVVNILTFSSLCYASNEAGNGHIVERKPINIHWAAGSSAGALSVTGNVLGGMLAEMYDGYSLTPEVTTGGVENCKLMLMGDANFISIQADDALATRQGERDWKEIPEVRDLLRYVSAAYVTKYNIFVPARDGDAVNSFEDLKGRRIGVLAGTTYLNGWPLLLKAYGMTENDFESVDVMARPDLCNAIQDGAIDGIFDITTENTIHQEAANAIRGYKVLSLSDNAIQKLKEWNPAYVDAIIPADYYAGNAEAKTIGAYNIWCTTADMDYQVVYDILTCMHKYNAELKAAHPDAGVTPIVDDIVKSQVIPWHPAAEQFYKDLGLLK